MDCSAKEDVEGHKTDRNGGQGTFSLGEVLWDIQVEISGGSQVQVFWA